MSDTIDQIPENPAGASPVAPGTPDRTGVPFDPARHIAKKHPTTGRWMPKGGRKPKPALASSGSTSSPQASTAPASQTPSLSSPTGSPSETVSIDDLIPVKDAPPPATAPGKKAPIEEPIPEIGAGETASGTNGAPASAPSTPAPAAPAAPRPDVRAGHEVAAELSARVVYSITGALIKDHKKATATGEEHKAIKAGFAAFYEHRGVVFVGTIALGLILVSYAMGETRREEVTAFVRGVFTKKKAPLPVVEIEARPTPEKTPAPAASAAPVIESAFGS